MIPTGHHLPSHVVLTFSVRRPSPGRIASKVLSNREELDAGLEEIKFSYINDNPATAKTAMMNKASKSSACPQSRFYCEIQRHIPAYILATLTIETFALPESRHAAQLTPAPLPLDDTQPKSAEQGEPRSQTAVLLSLIRTSAATYGRPSSALETRSASVDLGQRTQSSSVVGEISGCNPFQHASSQLLPGPLISLVPSAFSILGGALARTGQAVLGVVGAGGGSSGMLQSPPLNPTQPSPGITRQDSAPALSGITRKRPHFPWQLAGWLVGSGRTGA
ncbi:hypothetical protein V8E36_000523 [Tilletia maclaganii]